MGGRQGGGSEFMVHQKFRSTIADNCLTGNEDLADNRIQVPQSLLDIPRKVPAFCIGDDMDGYSHRAL